MSVLVLTVDQRDSRTSADRVPSVISLLDPVPTLRPFEQTVGDEVQGVLDSPAALPDVIELLLREDAWHVGIGAGEVETPLPASTRSGRGPAFVHARTAVTAAKSSPWNLRVVGDSPWARRLETTLWLWAAVLARRTARGWEVADLAAQGLQYDEIARRLGISPSAVSQRAAAAGIVEARRARELVTELAACLLGKEPS